MIQLQRASAGSGKTYALAGFFIWFLISVDKKSSDSFDSEENPGRRLRTPREILDALPSIMAITFTNKATEEMKARIIEKLAAMARADGGVHLSDDEIRKIDYLCDFADKLNVSVRDMGKACRFALSALLNNYSDFRVSTIDSFFQSVLRTFAYETNLNESFQVEVENDFLNRAATDAILEEINEDNSRRSSFWIQTLMDRAAEKGDKNWNIFTKSGGKYSLYKKIRENLNELQKEEFKEIRVSLSKYFDSSDSDPLAQAYKNISERIRQKEKDALDDARDAAILLRKRFEEHNLDIAKVGHRYLAGHVEKLINPKEPKDFTYYDYTAKSIFRSGEKIDNPEPLIEAAAKMYDAYRELDDFRTSREYKLWNIYSELIPYLGLIATGQRKISELLDANNSIQLSETNSMLSRIIGKSDAPFVYERLGATIDHYLIDEFQDTSRMQWENMVPLLHESDGRGEHNLIIGDAKQSIYRFRNADPSLIVSGVPEEFPDCTVAGMTRKENTNWRSCRTIVEFNNFFFSSLIPLISKLSRGIIDFPSLYANVAQYSHDRERAGYVEINYLLPPDKKKSDDGDEEDGEDPVLPLLGPLVRSLIDRGYRQREIAFLVDTNEEGKDIVQALVEYNSNLKPGETPIEFMSEQSLLVSSSDAVSIIVAVLTRICAGSDRHDSGSENKRVRFDDIKCNLNFFALRHPELPQAEQVERFLSEGADTDAIDTMLADMQTSVIPALVEAIVDNFVPEEMRRSQAVFISAFQDLVLDFCERSTADLASFLEWWNLRGVELSISSPEGTDAVSILTVHKSKGLEYECVIIPFAKKSIAPVAVKSEWKWVKPDSCFSGNNLPDFLPVATKSNLVGTPHENVFNEYSDKYMMDKLNNLYVAFTRAVSELYIFGRLKDPEPKPEEPVSPDSEENTTKKKKKSKKTENKEEKVPTNISSLIHKICSRADSHISELASSPVADLILPAGMSQTSPDSRQTSFGTPSTTAEIQERREKKKKQSGKRNILIEDYHVNSSPSMLHYVETSAPDSSSASEVTEKDDEDPRSEGNLFHAAMQEVKVMADFPLAFASMRMRGLVNTAKTDEWSKILEPQLSRPEIARWFDNKWNVLNERSIIFPNNPSLRPDRVMIAPDRSKAVVVDYKFGAIPSDNTHIEQMDQYKKAIAEATGIRNIEGYIWYVRLAKVVNV